MTAPNSVGCDSVVTLNLKITGVNTGVTQAGCTLIANQSEAIYQWISCPSMNAIAGTTSQTFSATSNGDYAVIDNACCDIYLLYGYRIACRR